MLFSPASDIFRSHLEELFLNEQTYKQLALRLGVSDSCLKSWLTKQRTPSIRSIDKVANQVGCFTYQFIKPDQLILGKCKKNDSHISFCRNLGVIFIEHQCFSVPQKLALLNQQVSDFALSSYLRTVNYKLPTLEKLDDIAHALGIETYSLLFEEDYLDEERHLES